jgi:hypothetical protein
MPTQDYKNAAGERVPGNTTVISSNLGWSKQALMYWAWAQGKDGKDFRQSRDEAADAGTLGHALIEADIKDRALPDLSKYPKEISDKAEAAFLNYLEWKRQTHFTPITMEVPLISEILQAGTTIDVIGWVANKRSIVECKTSNSVYEDFLIQVAMQKFAWDETHPDEPIEALHLLKVGKEEATFTHHYWHALPDGLEAFKHLRALHDLKKKLKKLV